MEWREKKGWGGSLCPPFKVQSSAVEWCVKQGSEEHSDEIMQNYRCRTTQSLRRTSHCKNMNSCIGKGVWNLDTVEIKPSHHSGCCCNKCRRRKLTPLSSAPTILFSWIYLRYYLDHTSLLFYDHWKKLPFPSILNNSPILFHIYTECDNTGTFMGLARDWFRETRVQSWYKNLPRPIQ